MKFKCLVISIILVLMQMIPASASTGDQILPVSSINDENMPYIIDKNTGNVLYYNLNDFQINTHTTYNNNGTQGISYSGTIAVPYSSKSLSYDGTDETYSVRVAITLYYNREMISYLYAYQPVRADVTYTILDSSVHRGTAQITIYGHTAEVEKQNTKYFSTLSSSVSADTSYPYVTADDHPGICGAESKVILQHGVGTEWEFVFPAFLVNNRY